ncbi:MAG TPA: SCP2 sterol-binding domain-containing protein [Candidatus Competibacteraceae bacterium]|nr:SCP2 sterol-binding domain-containing protein [Candidatus Competibacteraceae bacterium]
MTPTQLAAAALETALARYLALDPEGAARLRPFADKVIALELTLVPDQPLTLYLLGTGERLQVGDSYAGEPDLRLRGHPLALARLALEPGVSEGVEIIGDTALARQLAALITQGPDWEEWLSRFTGDVIAHQIGSTVRSILAWHSRTLETLLRNTGEYLQYETHDLPPARSLESFAAQIDILRDDVERLAARVERLRRRLDSAS